jgi:hypothetical protein
MLAISLNHQPPTCSYFEFTLSLWTTIIPDQTSFNLDILAATSILPTPSSQVLINKRPQTAHPCIHAREPSKRTPSAPAHSPNHRPLVVYDRAPAVSLARVLAARVESGTHHVLCDFFGRAVRCVVSYARLARDDGDVDSAQRGGGFGGVFRVAPLCQVSYGGMREGKGGTYQPATVAMLSPTGSEPAAARVAYLTVELSGMGVASFRMPRSLSWVSAL